MSEYPEYMLQMTRDRLLALPECPTLRGELGEFTIVPEGLTCNVGPCSMCGQVSRSPWRKQDG